MTVGRVAPRAPLRHEERPAGARGAARPTDLKRSVMDKIVITASNIVNADDVRGARLGPRFGRMDLMSQLALLAVEPLAVHFESIPRDRIAICLAARASSLATDVEYWKGRDNAGGPSPTLFTYTLPSAALGEIAIRHRITGPPLCFVGAGDELTGEAMELMKNGEVDGCVCVDVNVVTPALNALTGLPVASEAKAFFIERTTGERIDS